MPSHNAIDLTGKRFSMLTVTLRVGVANGKTRWECVCDCGAVTVKAYQHLVLGLTRSCGCLRKRVAARNMRALSSTHGLSKFRWWRVWSGMINRCTNPAATRYHRYGGRGIAVCDRWKNAALFFADMGEPPPGMTLERIDNDANYCPDNCRWATYEEQNNNRRSTKYIEFGGLRLSGAAWARKIGVSKATMYWRLKEWPLDRALTRTKEDS